MKNLVFFVSLFLLISCQKEAEQIDSQSIKSLNKAIVGEWAWSYSINPWTEAILTPQTENYTERLVFDADHTLNVFRADTLLEESVWIFKKLPTDLLNPTDSIIYLLIDETPDFFELSRTTLRINQTPYDGFDRYYNKLR